MIATLRRIRCKLQLVSYYSANREQNAWTRTLGWALVVSLLLPVPLVLIGESLHETEATLDGRSGGLAGDPDGVIEAVVRNIKEPELRLRWPDGAPYAEWTLEITERRRGWPFASARIDLPVRLDLDLFEETRIRIDAKLAADSPVRAALELALSEPKHQPMLAAWHTRTTGEVHRYWLGTITGLMLWWITLSLASYVAVFLLRIRLRRRRAGKNVRAQRRQSKGRCGTCDYDLRGLEFNERCPECGSLIT